MESNEHFMGAVVGREGSGKSHTSLKIGEMVDPSFHAGRVVFDPADFLARIRDDSLGKGTVIVFDESGIGLGARTWYDEDQIMLNKVLQLVRNENMACIFTLPRLEELDSQTDGRLISLLELVEKNEEEGYVRGKWKNIDPTRDGQGKIYKKYPRRVVGGREICIESVAFTPPSEELVEEYEQRKRAFQSEYYAEAEEALRDDGEDEEPDLREIASQVAQDIDEYVSTHTMNGRRYINAGLIELDFEISSRQSETVKDLVEKQIDVSAEEGQ